MNDLWAVALAISVAAGARISAGVPLVVGVALVALALAARHPPMLCLGAGLLASTLGYRAWLGLTPPPASIVETTATLVTDPAEQFGGVVADARLPGGRRVELRASSRTAYGLRDRLAGERVAVRGELERLPARLRAMAAPRHVSARLLASDIRPIGGESRLAAVANDLRRTLARGARALPESQRALFTGFVIGDDRGSDERVQDQFHDAGLSHLLVVSGQNVAFVLAVFAPAMAAFSLRTRLAANLAVLVMFGVVTRWEPSVIRAEAMASIALLAFTLGRPVSTIRILALAVAALLLVDPLLAWSIGFMLSVGACTGIALFAARIGARVPGPRPIATALAVTAAAQIGVAPILIPVFGGVPLAALPANLLAAPAAGPIMAWGLSAGTVAGLAGGSIAAVLHWPTHVLVGWIAGVARLASSLGLPVLP